ncbi:MAG: phosphate/phosphite/phosphonate ABC transporter substrate-binding protein [Acidimicrobiia bacterium]|nr:phosphate/phosphite/phosphonate ABC transporter substrate-binding protein [Acidimicrobiia bacterium]MYC45379.1 phosphate/phosphite/phosphonate ABC transporter substrate-binding protein [Acidimicrobiia bacterium]MYI18714.1 phosphate/phosphite/phosphonate ABC transporter substrate-binding protein [Acidimicrobiia bacterium]
MAASAAVLAAALVAAGCAGSSGGGVSNLSTATTVAGVGAQPEAPAAAPTVIRLALEPDPIWEWLEDSGTRAAWEASRNIRIDVSHPFDQFAAFAGGHADVVLINVLDVPKFVEQPEREPVIIGKYTTDHSILAVPRSSTAETLEDLVDRRIAVESSLASTLLWGLIAEIRYGLDFRHGGADFDLVTVDPSGVADLVMRGDVDACVCTPEFSVRYLAEGRLRPLYDGMSAAAIYSTEIFGGEGFGAERGTIADAFIADAAWHRANMPAVDALLGLWEEGLAAWKRHKAQIVADYPHHFAIESDAEIAWLADYLKLHDWIVPSVYITEQEAETHNFAFGRLVALGLVPADAAPPEFDLAYSQELSALEEVLKPGSGSGGSEGDLDRLSTRLSVPEGGSGG